MGQVKRVPAKAVDLVRIERREQICDRFPNGDGKSRATNQERKQYHSPRGETYGGGENLCRVSNFAGRVREQHHESAIDIADQQNGRAYNQGRAERAAAMQPVAHNDQPTNSNDGAAAQSEIVEQTKLVRQLRHRDSRCERINTAANPCIKFAIYIARQCFTDGPIRGA